jgi:hypothetical protein
MEKAPGIDGIPAEYNTKTISDLLYPLFRDIWNKDTFLN